MIFNKQIFLLVLLFFVACSKNPIHKKNEAIMQEQKKQENLIQKLFENRSEMIPVNSINSKEIIKNIP